MASKDFWIDEQTIKELALLMYENRNNDYGLVGEYKELNMENKLTGW